MVKRQGFFWGKKKRQRDRISHWQHQELCVCCVLSRFSHVWLFATLWTVAHQAPLSKGLSRQEYWSGLPCPPLEDLPNPRDRTGISSISCIAGGFFTHWATWVALWNIDSSFKNIWTQYHISTVLQFWKNKWWKNVYIKVGYQASLVVQ